MIDDLPYKPSVIQASINSCYRAGWPQPDDIVRLEDRFEGEANEDYAARLSDLREAHRIVMVKVVTDALVNEKLDHLFKLGPLAATNFNKAMYILGYHEER